VSLIHSIKKKWKNNSWLFVSEEKKTRTCVEIEVLNIYMLENQALYFVFVFIRDYYRLGNLV